MDGLAQGPPLVALPGRLDRRLRLGPFASGRDALKFLGYAAVGLVFAPTPEPLLAVPFVLTGALVTLYRPGGEGLDARLATVVRYGLRRARSGASVTAAPTRLGAHSGVVARGDGRVAAVLRTGGVPLAFLPPGELARRFDLYRDLLRSLDGEVRILATTAPIFARALLPGPANGTERERAARDGYAELVRLLLAGRRVRRVYVALSSTGAAEGALGRLEVGVGTLLERLSALGLDPRRLEGRALWAAAGRLGLRPSGEAG